tara:strand:- start:158 stop:523 length:366 start_codon:yes stop_codon:yes gene_type:complete
MTTAPEQRGTYQEYKAKKAEIDNLKASAVRCTPMWLLHLLVPPVVSIAYCSKIGKWTPALAATAAACVTIPLDIAGTAVLSMIIPPAISASMISSTVTSSRKKLGIVMPEEADERMFNRGF